MLNTLEEVKHPDGRSEWVPAEPIPYYPPKKRNFWQVIKHSVKYLFGKESAFYDD